MYTRALTAEQRTLPLTSHSTARRFSETSQCWDSLQLTAHPAYYPLPHAAGHASVVTRQESTVGLRRDD